MKKRDRDKPYPAARLAVFERADGQCEMRVSNNCSGRCEQVHHLAGRGGAFPHDLGNLAGCCRFCHEWVHRNPAAARELGWMRTRHRQILDSPREMS